MRAQRLPTRTVLALVVAVCQQAGQAQQVEYVEQDGVTYRLTRQIVRQPVWETRYEERQQNVYRPQVKTETRRMPRTTYTPVTEYRWVATLRGRWNPFALPYYTYNLQPVQYWRTQQEEADVTVQTYDWVPETQTVRVPVTSQRIAEREIVHRVAVAARPPASTVAAELPGGVTYGGIALLGEDPPRYGAGQSRPAYGTAWRPANQAVRR